MNDASSDSRVFISYRREESAAQAGRLFDRLVDRLGEENVFMDVDSIDPGTDFEQAVTDAVASSRVLLAVIGDRWTSATDSAGNRRLDDEHDFVRVEIETALAREIRVIPVLINGAAVPGPESLPDRMRGLSRRQSLELDDRRFRTDVERLFTVVDAALERPVATPAAEPRARDAVATTAPAWTATVTEQSHARRTFKLELVGHHVLSINAWFDTVSLDGAPVIKKALRLRGTHAFVIADGDVDRDAILELDIDWMDRIRHVVLRVDGNELHRE